MNTFIEGIKKYSEKKINSENVYKVIMYYGKTKIQNIMFDTSLTDIQYSNMMDKIYNITKGKKIEETKTYVFEDMHMTIKKEKETKEIKINYDRYFPVKSFMTDNFFAVVYVKEKIEKEKFPIISNYDIELNEEVTRYKYYCNYSKKDSFSNSTEKEKKKIDICFSSNERKKKMFFYLDISCVDLLEGLTKKIFSNSKKKSCSYVSSNKSKQYYNNNSIH